MPQPPPPYQPPHKPPFLHHHHHKTNPTVHNLLKLKPTNLPDFLLTALSLLLFITAPKHHLSLRPPPLSLSFTPPQPTTNRRFSRLSTTSMSQQNPRNPNFTSFPTPQSLSDWLKPRLPSDSFSTWGTKPGTKNVHNLWLEVADGETSLVDSTPPLRNLEVVCVRIKKIIDTKVLLLIESYQELSDGSIRKRDRPLSEKMKAGESVEDAVKRGIKEELGSVIGEKDGAEFDEIVKVVFESYERKVEERVSDSYPGLPGYYVFHTVDAFVDGLPEGEFVTEEGNEYGEVCDDDHNRVSSEAVALKRHFWKWVPVENA